MTITDGFGEASPSHEPFRFRTFRASAHPFRRTVWNKFPLTKQQNCFLPFDTTGHWLRGKQVNGWKGEDQRLRLSAQLAGEFAKWLVRTSKL